MIPKLLHIVWLGDNPPPITLTYLEQWADHHGWDINIWNEASFRVRPEVWSQPSFAGRSNYLRLLALYIYGGVYVDADVVLLRPIDDLLPHAAFVCRQPDGVLCNAVIGATPEHPWIKRMLDTYDFTKDPAWACHHLEPNLTPDVRVLDSYAFYPWNWDAKDKPFGVHLWEGSWLK